MARPRLFPLLLLPPVLLLVLAAAGRRTLAAPDQGHPLGPLNKFLLIGHAFTNRRAVALTFDDGPDPRFTPAVLRILREHRARATFFVVGEEAGRWPGLIREELAGGNEVENHTYSHPELYRLSLAEVDREIARCDGVLHRLSTPESGYFRPPREKLSLAILRSARAKGKQIILAGVSLEHHEVHTPGAMVARVLGRVRPGSIILAHDGRLDRRKTVAALPLLLAGLEAKGYRLVTLRELLARAQPDKAGRTAVSYHRCKPAI